MKTLLEVKVLLSVIGPGQRKQPAPAWAKWRVYGHSTYRLLKYFQLCNLYLGGLLLFFL